VLRRSLPLVLSTALFVLSSYATNVLLGRHLGPAQYGVFGLITSLMSALNVMQTTGVPQAMAKFVAEDEDNADDVLAGGLRLQMGLSVTLMALLVGLGPALSRLFHEHSLTGYLAIAAFILPGYGLFAVYAGYNNGLHRFTRTARINGSYAVAKVALVVVLVLRYGLAGALVGLAVAAAVAFAVGRQRARPHGRFPRRQLLDLSAPLVAFSVLQLLQYSVDLFTVKAVVHSSAASGYYVAAQNISVIPFLGLAAINQVVLPSVSRALSVQGSGGAGQAVGQAIRYELLLLLPATALIVGSAPEVVDAIFGHAYAPAGVVLRILATSYVFVTGFSLLASILGGAGRAKDVMALAAVALLTTLVLCVALVPEFGLKAAATSVGVGAAVATIGALLRVRRLLPFALPRASVVRIVVGVTGVLGLAWVPVPSYAIVVTWPVIVMLFAGWLLVAGEISAAERSQLRGLLRRGGPRAAAP
jgi:stage V sporulation protein B